MAPRNERNEWNEWRKNAIKVGGPSSTRAAVNRSALDPVTPSTGEGGVVERTEQTGLFARAQYASYGVNQLALAGTATEESAATISRKIDKYERLMSGAKVGGGTRISAQSFGAGSERWAGRVGPDRSAPNSFGNPEGLRSAWLNGGLGGAGSLRYRWDKEGNLRGAAAQQAAFEEGQKPVTTSTGETGGKKVDTSALFNPYSWGDYTGAGGITSTTGEWTALDGSRESLYDTIAAFNELGAGDKYFMEPAARLIAAEEARLSGKSGMWRGL